METLDEKIKAIEQEIRKTPYHKGTQHHIGRLRARIARLKEEIAQREIKGRHGGGEGFVQKKYGDATVVLVGPPSVGKSTLLNKLTRAQSKVAAYDFTTLEVIPGMMEYNGAKIQIFDIPGIIGGATKGRGRGREILSVARVADLLILMTDIHRLDQLETIQKELYEAGLRLGKKMPEITVHLKTKGGLKIISSSLKPEVALGITQEFRLTNAEIVIKGVASEEDLIDALLGNRVFLPSLVVVNKTDLLPEKNVNRILAELGRVADILPVSAEKMIGLEKLKEGIWQKLGLIRVFLKPPRRQVDLANPLILKSGQTIKEASQKIHAELVERIKSAQVWGKSAKFPGQTVSLRHKLSEGDIITFLTQGKNYDII